MSKVNSRNLNVVIRNLDKSGFANVYIQYSQGGKVKRFETGVKALPAGFEDGALVKCAGAAWREHNATIADRTTTITAVYSTLDKLVKRYSEDYGVLPSVEVLAELYAGAKAGGAKVETKGFWQCFNAYRVEMESKAQAGTAKRNTARTLKPLASLLRDFEKARGVQLTFNSFDFQLFHALNEFQVGNGKLNGTVRTRIAKLKAVLNHFVKIGLCKNVSWREYKFPRKVQKDAPNGQRIFALSETEFKEFMNVDLGGNKRLTYAQDLFILCASTGLRYSDAIRVRPEHIVGDTLRITTAKTGDSLTIPLNQYSAAVLAKYPKGMKKVDLSHYNERLLAIAQQCPSLDIPFSMLAYSGGREVLAARNDEVKNRRWQFVTSHAGRRTFVCLCLLKGIPEFKIRSITGHKQLSSFMAYVDNEVGGNAVMKAFAF